MSLDKLTLDAMVRSSEPDDEAWKALILEPDRENQWQEAVKRREQLDRFCTLAASWPNLAKSFRTLKNISKAVKQPPSLSCILDMPHDQLFSAVMGGGEEIENLVSNIPWGQQHILEINAPKRITFQATFTVHIYYEYSLGAGWITSEDAWDFKDSDGAVLLSFFDIRDRHSEDLEQVAQQSESVASIVLLPS